tara:strand:- start:801 stop:2087 length:1287 start_codon:yes stop_codon:yes gene_type:complete
MKYSSFFIPTKKEDPSDAKIMSHKLMIKSGMIRQEASGIYSWLPLGYRVIKRIQEVIEEFHNENGINQILMPTIQSADIWKKSERYDTYGKEMLKILDRHNKDLLYGPTNEEMITALGKNFIKSYKNLPRYFYHIQSKFRDEIRPRFGVMRAREFLMKDAYSFDVNEEAGKETYLMFFKLYLRIFKRLGIPIVPVRAPTGEIGGDLSHEFHLIVGSGESDIYIDESLISSDFEKLSIDEIISLNSFTDEMYLKERNKQNLKKLKSIELGHIFLFGTKYSKSFDFFIDGETEKFFPFMGSYGIGISRIPAAIIEYQSEDNTGIVWPKNIAPFTLLIINLKVDDENISKFCKLIYHSLKKIGVSILYDDRNERPGIKFSDAELIGIPYNLIVGKNFIDKETVTLKDKYSDEEFDFKVKEAEKKILEHMKH